MQCCSEAQKCLRLVPWEHRFVNTTFNAFPDQEFQENTCPLCSFTLSRVHSLFFHAAQLVRYLHRRQGKQKKGWKFVIPKLSGALSPSSNVDQTQQPPSLKGNTHPNSVARQQICENVSVRTDQDRSDARKVSTPINPGHQFGLKKATRSNTSIDIEYLFRTTRPLISIE